MIHNRIKSVDWISKAIQHEDDVSNGHSLATAELHDGDSASEDLFKFRKSSMGGESLGRSTYLLKPLFQRLTDVDIGSRRDALHAATTSEATMLVSIHSHSHNMLDGATNRISPLVTPWMVSLRTFLHYRQSQ